MKKYEYIEHTADIQFKAFGKSLEEVFENSALAMSNAISDDKVKSVTKKSISVKGNDNEALLYNFLEELLFLFDSEYFMLSGVNSLQIKDKELTAEVSGDEVKKYDIKIDVKAITYNNMFVKQEAKDKFVSQVVLDV